MPRKITALALLLLLLLSLCACSKAPAPAPPAEEAATGYILSRYALLPEEITRIPCCFSEGERLVLCCWESAEEGAPLSYAASVSLDGRDFQKLPLALPAGAQLLNLSSDGNGGLWAILRSPGGEDEPSRYALCRFDAAGEQTAEIGLNALMEACGALRWAGDELFLSRDGEGRLCVTIRSDGAYCLLFDPEGKYLFSLVDSWLPESVILKADGRLAVCNTAGDGQFHLLPIDPDAKAFDYATRDDLGAISRAFDGDANGEYYYYDFSSFWAFDQSTGEKRELFNWSSLGLASGDVHVCALPDGRFAVIAGTFNQTQQLQYELCLVEPGTDRRRVLTMFSLQPESSVLEAVALFNKSSDSCRIELTCAFSLGEEVSGQEWDEAVQRFLVELTAGEIPDLLDLNGLPVEALAGAGYLVDLYPYLLNDPTIRMEDYYENVFTALSIRGKLPYLTSSVQILTMFADEAAVGAKRGWTLEEFTARKNDGTIVVSGLEPSRFLEMLLAAQTRFVNWETGECSFDSEAFVRLLELCRSLADSEESTQLVSPDSRANCRYAPLSSVIFVAQYNEQLGRNANPIGFPSESGEPMHILVPANKIGITTACQDPDGAWCFVRSLLEPTLQESGWFFPYRRDSFEKIASEAMKGNSIWSGGMVEAEITGQDLALARELLGSALYCENGDAELIALVLDAAQDYFSGGRSAWETAEFLQKQALLYVGERR